MVAVLLSWIVIILVLLTFGDIFSSLYNKLCRKEEAYNLMDKLVLGLCSVMIPLQIWSLCFPSGHFFLLFCMTVCLVYWMIRRKRFLQTCTNIRLLVKRLPMLCLVALAVLFAVILLSNIFTDDIFDSLFYHYQFIRWNEEYALIPGLGNIDDRFGFNSAYLLLSAPFTFRALFGEAVFSLQNVLVLFLSVWIISELFRSRFEAKRIILLGVFTLFYLISIKLFQNTSTDLLPNMVLFYLASRLILYPHSLKENSLLFLVAPAFLLICKLSVAPVCLLTLYLLIYYIRSRNMRAFGLSVLILLLLIAPWLVRNVILSGYLIYPLSQIDLFSFDWKIPSRIAILQNEYIYTIGHDYFGKLMFAPMIKYREAVWVNLLSLAVYALSVLSVLFIGITGLRKKMPASFWLLVLILVTTICIWFFKAPDIRFVLGALCAVIVLGLSNFSIIGKRKNYYSLIGKALLLVFLLSITVWSGWRITDKYAVIAQLRESDNSMPPFGDALLKQYSIKNIFESNGFVKQSDFEPHKLNNDITIYVAPGYTMDDLLPAVAEKGKGGQFLDYRCLEARSDKLQDGFRTRKDCEY